MGCPRPELSRSCEVAESRPKIDRLGEKTQNDLAQRGAQISNNAIFFQLFESPHRCYRRPKNVTKFFTDHAKSGWPELEVLTTDFKNHVGDIAASGRLEDMGRKRTADLDSSFLLYIPSQPRP